MCDQFDHVLESGLPYVLASRCWQSKGTDAWFDCRTGGVSLFPWENYVYFQLGPSCLLDAVAEPNQTQSA